MSSEAFYTKYPPGGCESQIGKKFPVLYEAAVWITPALCDSKRDSVTCISEASPYT